MEKGIENGIRQCFVVGGGSSLTGFDFPKLSNVDTIVINKSIFDVPNPNYFITADYTFLKKINLKFFERIETTKIFIADFHFPYLREKNAQIVDTRFNLIYDLRVFNLIIKARREKGVGFTFNDFRTGSNSGYCALQLAIIFGYTRILLLGMDMNKSEETHYHGGYGESAESFNRKLDVYYVNFRIGLKQLKDSGKDIKVISCSPTSRLNGIIEYKDVEGFL